jgi:hypothetical protein
MSSKQISQSSLAKSLHAALKFGLICVLSSLARLKKQKLWRALGHRSWGDYVWSEFSVFEHSLFKAILNHRKVAKQYFPKHDPNNIGIDVTMYLTSHYRGFHNRSLELDANSFVTDELEGNIRNLTVGHFIHGFIDGSIFGEDDSELFLAMDAKDLEATFVQAIKENDELDSYEKRCAFLDRIRETLTNA